MSRFKTPPGAPTSRLLSATWRLPRYGEVTVQVPLLQDLKQLDARWGAARSPADPASAWSWYEIGRASPDRFALVASTGEVLAVWAAFSARLLMLRDGFAYRLDRLEVAPGHRRRGIGAFAVCTVADRAIERGSELVVYGAVNDVATLAFHRALGAEERTAAGWSAPPDLVPFVLAGDALTGLARHAHDLRI